MRLNLGRGVLRLWVLLSVLWTAGVGLYAATLVYGNTPCLTFETITIDEGYGGPDATTAAELRRRLLAGQTFCVREPNSDLLSVERFARQRAISQVGFSWLEPQGWSLRTRDWLMVLEGREITAEAILNWTARSVHQARWTHYWPLILAAALVPLAVLLLGLGIRWVARGFRQA